MKRVRVHCARHSDPRHTTNDVSIIWCCYNQKLKLSPFSFSLDTMYKNVYKTWKIYNQLSHIGGDDYCFCLGLQFNVIANFIIRYVFLIVIHMHQSADMKPALSQVGLPNFLNLNIPVSSPATFWLSLSWHTRGAENTGQRHCRTSQWLTRNVRTGQWRTNS